MDEVDRVAAVLTAGEREQLEAFLDDARHEVVALLDGVTEEQGRRRLVRSSTTLLGLVKHAAFVERVWSDVALAGRSRAELGLPEAAEDSWVLGAEDTVPSVRRRYRDAWASSLQVVAGHDLDGLALHNRRGPLSLRWVYLHLVRELSRHAGHGDILREQLLAGG